MKICSSKQKQLVFSVNGELRPDITPPIDSEIYKRDLFAKESVKVIRTYQALIFPMQWCKCKSNLHVL